MSVVWSAWERKVSRIGWRHTQEAVLCQVKGDRKGRCALKEEPGPYTDILPPGLCEDALELIHQLCPENVGIAFKPRSNSLGCQIKLPRNLPAWCEPTITPITSVIKGVVRWSGIHS